MFISFLKNIDFFWAWFTSGLDLGGWAHVCQLLQARPKSSVGTALPPQADGGVRGRGGKKWRTVPGCAQLTPWPLLSLSFPGPTISGVCSALGTPKAMSSSSPLKMWSTGCSTPESSPGPPNGVAKMLGKWGK